MTKQYLRDLHDSEVVDNMKINCQDYFELVYLRHRYFRRSENPSPDRLKEFEEMLCNIASKFFVNNYQVFNEVGFEMEDLKNIARIHTVSFISMSGLKENPDKMEKFRKRHKKKCGNHSEPGKMDIFKKECYDLARFLNQRMQELAMFSQRKNKNIRGTVNERGFFIGDPKVNPNDIDLISYPETYGYKKISAKKFQDLVKDNDAKNKKSFMNGNQMVRAVYLTGNALNFEDVQDLDLDPRNSIYYGDPEQNLITLESEKSTYHAFLEELRDKEL